MTTAASYSNLVQELYLTYFGRPADSTGLQNFEAAMAAANAPTNIADLTAAYATSPAIKTLIDSFGTSPESTLLYGQVTTSTSSATSFVNAVFENLLNRAPAAAGLNFWVQAITSGNVSLGNAALSIAAGAMANSTAQGLLDATTINNKLAVAAQFTASVSDSAGIAEYSGPAAALLARSLLSGVDSNTQTQNYQANIQQTLTTLGAAITENTYTLTSGTDNLAGSSLGSNTFNATLDNAAGLAAGNAAATLNAGDSVTGGATIGSNAHANILNINDFGLGGSVAIPAASISGMTGLNLQSAEAVGTLDFSTWAGLQTVNIGTSHGADNVTVGANTSLSLHDSGASGAIVTNGGSAVSVFSDNSRSITVNGGSTTTSASVSGGNSILVVDSAYAAATTNSIASVSINAPGGTSTIESDALSSLNIANDTGFAVTASASVSLTPLLALALDNVNNATINVANNLGLHVTSSATASSGVNLIATDAGSLNFNDSAGLSLASLSAPGAIVVNIAGAGDFSANLSNISSHAVVNAANAAGVTTLELNGTQSFTGGSGQDNVTINSLAGSIIGGSAGDNSINFVNVTFTLATPLSNFPNFATWETSSSTSGDLDLATIKGVNALVVNGAGGDLTFSDIQADTPISLLSSDSHAITLGFIDAEATTPGTMQVVNLGTTTSTGVTIEDLAIPGFIGLGVGVIDFVSNSAAAQINQIDDLTDASLNTLEVNGNAAIDIGNTLDTAAAVFKIEVNAGSATTTIAGLNDSLLNTLNIQSYGLTLGTVTSSSASLNLIGNGAGAIAINGIVDSQLTSAQVSEVSTSINTTNTVTIGDSNLPALQSLSLNGYVAIKVDGVHYALGFDLSGATDNAPVSFSSVGSTNVGLTDSVTLGNGNDQVTLGQGQFGSIQNITLGNGVDAVTTSTSGNVNVVLGTPTSGEDSVNSTGNNATIAVTAGNGTNQISVTGLNGSVAISLGSGSNTIALVSGTTGTVTVAAHSGSDSITISTVGPLTTAANILAVSGLANTGTDTITLGDSSGSASSFVEVTAAEVTASGGTLTSLASWVAAALGKDGSVTQVAHGIEWFQFQGNTYLIETATAGDTGKFSLSDSAIELTGTSYTFAHSTFSNGVVHLLG